MLVGILGVFGAALFFGDGVITPAISVLSAVEGLEVAAPRCTHWIVPIAARASCRCCSRSSASAPTRSARVFGPVMVLWFLALAVLGMRNIVQQPGRAARARIRW